jgi:hypothetical protein
MKTEAIVGLIWISLVATALLVAHPALLASLGASMGTKMQPGLLSAVILPGAATINFIFALRGARSTGVPGPIGRTLLRLIALPVGGYALALAGAFAWAGQATDGVATPIMGSGLGILVAVLAVASVTVGWSTGLALRSDSSSA